MNIIDKIQMSVYNATELHMYYDSFKRLNQVLDNAEFPCVFLRLLNTSTISNNNGMLCERVIVNIYFVNQTEFDFESYENEEIIDAMKVEAMKFVTYLATDTTLKLSSLGQMGRSYDQMAVNLTGFVLSMVLEEREGITACGTTPYPGQWATKTYVNEAVAAEALLRIAGDEALGTYIDDLVAAERQDRMDADSLLVPYTGATGDVDLGTHGITTDFVDFNDAPVSTVKPFRMQYSPVEKTLEFGLDDGGMLQIGKEMFNEYVNVDTVPLTNGMIVSTAAIPGNRKGVKRTDFANFDSIRNIVGMVTVPSIAINGSGRVTTKGVINDLNTNGFAEGVELWGNPAAKGLWNATKPTKGNYAVQIGQVVVSSNTVGSVELNVNIDHKFTDLADVNGATTLIADTDTIPKRDADGIIREITVANVKADFKADTDALYEPLLGFTPENIANKGQANGYASLGADGLVPSNQLPSFVDDVLEFANLAAFPAVGEQGKIYVALDTNKTYRWSGSTYIYITSGAVDSVAGKTGVVTLVKADVGLANVDNTSDANKPISTATQTALNGKVNNAGNETIAGIKTFSSSPIVPNPTTVTQALNKGTADGSYVALTGAQNVAGVKTFSSSPIVPNPTTATEAMNKCTADGTYVSLTATQSISGVKTFIESPIIPTGLPGEINKAASIEYVDTAMAVIFTDNIDGGIPSSRYGGTASLDFGKEIL